MMSGKKFSHQIYIELPAKKAQKCRDLVSTKKFKEAGTYYCAVCGNGLFKSDTKFESGCGWPSFYQPISKTSIIYANDNDHGMQRTEVMRGRCKSHLGHVFNDGPPPTHLRYCINGVVLDFQKAQEAQNDYNGQHKKG